MTPATSLILSVFSLTLAVVSLGVALSMRTAPLKEQRGGSGSVVIEYSGPGTASIETFNGGGGGGSYPKNKVPTDHEMQILLQYFDDHDGAASSYPSDYAHALYAAQDKKWIDDGMQSAKAAKANAGGVVTFKLTDKGRSRLKALVAKDPNAGRLVYDRKNIAGVGLTIYGAPTEQPLSAPFQKISIAPDTYALVRN